MVETKQITVRRPCTVEFYDGIDSSKLVCKTEVAFGESLKLPVAPSKTGYTFDVWVDDVKNKVTSEKNVEEDLKLYATWTANTYTVKFDSNGGNGTMDSLTFTYDKEEPLTANAFTRTGYTFAGWAESAGGNVVYADKKNVKNLKSENNATITLYAKWEIVTYTITYNNCDEATNTNPANYTVETDTIELADATKTGYTFDGWYDNANLTGEKITQIAKGSTGDITLYAKWIANKSGITITLPESNDPKINLQQVTNGDKVTFSANGGFASYAWYIDGDQQATATSAIFEVDTSTMNPANYSVMVIVTDRSQVYYSATAVLELKK